MHACFMVSFFFKQTTALYFGVFKTKSIDRFVAKLTIKM